MGSVKNKAIKKLKIGKHKVSITSANTNYSMGAKSTITIK